MEERGEIKTERKTDLSSVSKFMRILMKIGYFPLKKEQYGEYSFRLRSTETFITFILYVGCFMLIYFLCSVSFWMSIPDQELLIATVDLTDSLTQFGFSVSNFLLYPFLPLILAQACSSVPELSLHPALPWPGMGWKVLLCELFTSLGYLLNIGPNYLHYGREALRTRRHTR